MSKKLTEEQVQKELESVLTSNEQIKAAAKMVGYDVDAATDTLLENADQRIRVNLHQRGRINTLKSLLVDMEQP